MKCISRSTIFTVHKRYYGRSRIIESLELAKKVKTLLDDKKAENIVIIDVRQLSSITDYFVIASGANSPHLKALAGGVERALKDEGVHSTHRSGTFESQWIVLDYIDVVVHVFLPEVREYYSLERLWSDAPVVTPPL